MSWNKLSFMHGFSFSLGGTSFRAMKKRIISIGRSNWSHHQYVPIHIHSIDHTSSYRSLIFCPLKPPCMALVTSYFISGQSSRPSPFMSPWMPPSIKALRYSQWKILSPLNPNRSLLVHEILEPQKGQKKGWNDNNVVSSKYFTWSETHASSLFPHIGPVVNQSNGTCLLSTTIHEDWQLRGDR